MSELPSENGGHCWITWKGGAQTLVKRIREGQKNFFSLLHINLLTPPARTGQQQFVCMLWVFPRMMLIWVLNVLSKVKLDEEWRPIAKYSFDCLFPWVNCELLISISPDLTWACFVAVAERMWLNGIIMTLKNEVYQIFLKETKISMQQFSQWEHTFESDWLSFNSASPWESLVVLGSDWSDGSEGAGKLAELHPGGCELP